jgi:hypothetical protein
MTRLYLFARLSQPRCGEGIYEVNLESRLHISQALKTKLDLAIIFQNQMDKVELRQR